MEAGEGEGGSPRRVALFRDDEGGGGAWVVVDVGAGAVLDACPRGTCVRVHSLRRGDAVADGAFCAAVARADPSVPYASADNLLGLLAVAGDEDGEDGVYTPLMVRLVPYVGADGDEEGVTG